MPLYQALAQEAIEAVRQDTAFDAQLLHELLLGEGHIGQDRQDKILAHADLP